MRYKCKNCNKEIKINKEVLLFIDNKLVNKNAYCCNKQMDSMDKNEGMPTIIRNESNLSKYDKDKAFKKRKTE